MTGPFLAKYSLCILSRADMHSFGIFLSFKAVKIITLYIWEWENLFMVLLYV